MFWNVRKTTELCHEQVLIFNDLSTLLIYQSQFNNSLSFDDFVQYNEATNIHNHILDSVMSNLSYIVFLLWF